MSEETDISPEIASSPAAAEAPRARRVSTPRPKKKVAKVTPDEAVEANAPAPAEPVAPVSATEPVEAPSEPVEAPDAAEGAAVGGDDWPEPEAATVGGGQAPGEGGKRKRRRRKGKGGQSGTAPGAASPPAAEDSIAPVPADIPKTEESRDQRPRQNPQPQPQHPQPQRPKLDPEAVAKMAWKIYLAEVSEEGVALIGDNDAKDLSRRCFRLAEIFIEEQSRRR